MLVVILFPGNSDGKESACSAGDLGSIPGSGRSPGEGNGNPLQYPCLENPMDRSLVGYNPYSPKESDTTEAMKHAHDSIWVEHVSLKFYLFFRLLSVLQQ